MKKLAVVPTAISLFLLVSPRLAAAQPTDPAPELPPPAAAPAPTPAAAPSAVAPSAAETPPPAAQPDGPPRYDLIRINAGFRIGYVPNSSFDKFASSDVLSQFSIDATYPVFQSGRVVAGVGLGYDVGGRSDKLRGFDTSLTAHRFSVPIEARVHITPWLYGFGKIAPGATAMLTKVTDPSSPGTLATTAWAFSADASAGASFLMGPRQHLDKRGVIRFWLTPELGYAYTTDASVKLNPGRDSKDVLGSDENTKLQSLALSGFFWRATIGTTF